MLALQGLRDKGGIQPGQKLLINGAGGDVGTFAIQIARVYGVEVTGVDSPGKLDVLHSMGADHVIDYTREGFTRNGQSYDLIRCEDESLDIRLRARIEPQRSLRHGRRLHASASPSSGTRAADFDDQE
jgi:hypothetical protein